MLFRSPVSFELFQPGFVSPVPAGLLFLCFFQISFGIGLRPAAAASGDLGDFPIHHGDLQLTGIAAALTEKDQLFLFHLASSCSIKEGQGTALHPALRNHIMLL